MKKDEMKIGLYVGSEIPSRVLWFDERWAVVTNSYSDMPVVLDRKATIVDPSTPAELTAAGVPDSQRLVEQRSEWSGVRLWIGDFCTRPAYCWFTIDHGGWRPLDGYVHEGEVTTGKDYIGKYDGGDCVEVTTDPRYAWVYQREDVLQAVVKFRSERREAGLKWCGVCGVIIKSNGSRAEFWNGAKWLETCRIDSGFDTVATPEQIAQSGVPLSDIPDPALRASVEKLRTSLSSSFTVECADGKTLGISADMQCGKPVLSVTELESPSPAATRTASEIEQRLRSLVEVYYHKRQTDPIGFAEWVTSLDGLFRLARESLGTTAGGESK